MRLIASALSFLLVAAAPLAGALANEGGGHGGPGATERLATYEELGSAGSAESCAARLERLPAKTGQLAHGPVDMGGEVVRVYYISADKEGPLMVEHSCMGKELFKRAWRTGGGHG